MLSQPATPRPRPPAKTRRSSSSKFNLSTPPPPYAPSKFTFPASEPSASTSRKRSSLILEDIDWTQERSRDELKELLVHADGLIKERENDLDMTSAVCKTLYENNLTLKSKHEALLARIPGSSSSSPVNTPLYYTNSLPRDSGTSPLNGAARTRHTRRISFLPADIALLSDQNAELLHKLEQLEEESSTADQAGRRKLKKLEKEIQELRDELDSTHARSEELERKVEADLAVKRKKEREAEVFAARGKTPEGRVPRLEEDICPLPPVLNMATKPMTPTTDVFSEHELVSQLLLKIQELEETNAQITSQQAQTATKLHAVQRDASNMSQIYECLGEDTEEGGVWEMVVDDEQQQPKETKLNQTIRFRSLRRTLERDAWGFGDVFGDGIGGQSTVRNNRWSFTMDDSPSNFDNLTGTHRTRRSVVGLFGSDDSPTVSRRPPPLPSLESDVSPESQCSELPDMSPLSAFPAHTLGSELGSELGAGNDLGGAPHRHFRTDSLYDMSRMSSMRSPSPSQQPPLAEQSFSGLSSGANTEMGQPMQLNLEPPTPDSGESSKHTKRYRRMSQTVRSRTNLWVDGRFKETLPTPTKKKQKLTSGLAPPPPPSAAHRRVASASKHIPESIANALDVVLETFSSLSGNGSEDVSSRPVEEEEEAAGKAMELHKSSLAPRRTKGMEFFLEVWLWLQFVIIVLLFLWAMAKRGPKNVLAEAERRKGPLAIGAGRR